jgi:uracil-DNA glycosylase family 4
MDFFESQFECPICHTDKVVPAVGNEKSAVLIVAEFPAEEELEKGIPMVGPMGRVLRQELSILGLDMKQTRRTNLWLHPPNKNKDCLDYGTQEVIKEAKGKKAILLLGSDTAKVFVNKSVSDISGLVVESPYFSCPVVVCYNPAIVFQKGKGVGEIRLALKRFVELVERIQE